MGVRYLYFIILSIAFFSCTASRVVKPLAQGKRQIGVALGGPTVDLGVPLFLPLSAIQGAYGVDSNTTLFADLHFTSALFGIGHVDVGALRNIYVAPNSRFGITGALQANLMLDFWEGDFRFYPQIDLNSYYHYSSKPHYAYAGLANWFELRSTRAHGEKQSSRYIPNIHLGHCWQNKKWGHQVEAKYLAPIYSNENIVVDYISLGDKGSLGIYYTLTRSF